MDIVVKKVKATELSPMVGCQNSRLGDGTFLVRVSVQRTGVYVKGLRTDGHFVRRHYRLDQMVEVYQ